MPRNALTAYEFQSLAAAIGLVGDKRLRQTLAVEFKLVLSQHTSGLYGREVEYEWAEWFKLCRALAGHIST